MLLARINPEDIILDEEDFKRLKILHKYLYHKEPTKALTAKLSDKKFFKYLRDFNSLSGYAYRDYMDLIECFMDERGCVITEKAFIAVAGPPPELKYGEHVKDGVLDKSLPYRIFVLRFISDFIKDINS